MADLGSRGLTAAWTSLTSCSLVPSFGSLSFFSSIFVSCWEQMPWLLFWEESIETNKKLVCLNPAAHQPIFWQPAKNLQLSASVQWIQCVSLHFLIGWGAYEPWQIALFHRSLTDNTRQDVLRSSIVRYRPTNPDLVAAWNLFEFSAH